MAILVTIVVSSLGFILATEPTLQVCTRGRFPRCSHTGGLKDIEAQRCVETIPSTPVVHSHCICCFPGLQQYSEDSLVADSQILGDSLANFLGLPSGGNGADDDDTYRNAPRPRLFFFVLEAACILIFTVEYVARLLTIGYGENVA